MTLTSRETITTDNQQENSIFWVFCLGFVFLVLVIAFFSDDLTQLLTPFLYPILLIILAVIFTVILLFSLIFVPTRFKKYSWKAFLPLFINGINILVIIFLFLPLSKFRYEVEFLIKKKDYQKAIMWVDTSMISGQLVIKEGKPKLVTLPTKLQDITPGGFVIVEMIDGKVSVLFPAIFQGMFEYSPSFLYRPSGVYPAGLITPDMKCQERKELNWYYCF